MPVRVYSSYGDFSVGDDGTVLAWLPENDSDIDNNQKMAAVTKFNLPGYHKWLATTPFKDLEVWHTDIDIVHIGFWTTAGNYSEGESDGI